MRRTFITKITFVALATFLLFPSYAHSSICGSVTTEPFIKYYLEHDLLFLGQLQELEVVKEDNKPANRIEKYKIQKGLKGVKWKQQEITVFRKMDYTDITSLGSSPTLKRDSFIVAAKYDKEKKTLWRSNLDACTKVGFPMKEIRSFYHPQTNQAYVAIKFSVILLTVLGLFLLVFSFLLRFIKQIKNQ